MKRRLLLALLTAGALATAADAIRVPTYTKTTLPNGLRLYLLEQHEVPIVSLHVVLRSAGSVFDPPGKEGLAAVTAELIRRGTTTRSASEIAAALDFVGGTLDFDAAPDFSSGEAEFLKKDIDTGLDLVADVLTHPVFPPEEVAKTLARRKDEIRQQKDSASQVIGRYFNRYLFREHPYARPASGDEITLAALTRDDITAFYAGHYGPQSLTLAIVGDFESAAMREAVEKRFGKWKVPQPQPAPAIAAPKQAKGKRLLLVDKPDSTQTYFLIGNVGIARDNPDRDAVELVNTLFGGRFTSILNDALRVNSGLTYGARSVFREWRQPGPFYISTFTRNATTVEALDLALRLLDQLHEQGITAEQLKSAKAYVKGQFPPDIETSDQWAALLAEYDYYGLDPHELETYFARLDAVTLADARRVIQQYFPSDNLVFTLIGKTSEIQEQIKKYAPQLDRKDISQAGF